MNDNYPASGWKRDLYALVSRSYHNAFTQKSNGELEIIAQGKKPTGFFDALFGWEDREIRQAVAASIIKSRIGG